MLGVLITLAALIGASNSPSAQYDPLQVDSAKLPAPVELVVESEKRPLPIRVYLPSSKRPAPVVLFSHGLGGSREGNAYLGKHWSARGYVVVFLQHPGSDTSVWRDQPLSKRMEALRQAAGLENFLHRVRDVPAVLDQLAKWQESADHPLSGRLDMKRVGMSGHSFGAVTTQAVSGQGYARGSSFTDARIKAALAMSPSAPRRGVDPSRAFGSVRIPWMLMTGTQDSSPIGDADPASRLAVYPALPKGGKYELVFDGAEHSAFSERALPGDRQRRDPNHHRAILALSTAFWDSYLRDDPAARAWLDGDGPRGILQEKDSWKHK